MYKFTLSISPNLLHKIVKNRNIQFLILTNFCMSAKLIHYERRVKNNCV
jgi:hypothetical protein